MRIDFEDKNTKAKDIVAHLREKIRAYYGDFIENRSTVFAHAGRYTVNVDRGPDEFPITVGPFRRSQVKEALRYLRMHRTKK